MRGLLGGAAGWLLAAAVVLGVTLAAGLATCRLEAGQVTLFGSGSTFVQPAMVSWIRGFQATHPDVRIDYSGGGSGKGQQDILSGKVDFACSDPPLSPAKLNASEGEFLQFPVILGAVVVVYNIPGLEGVHLNLTGRILAEIYLGKVRYWDDPEILSANPALRGVLPHREIIAVHRSDASGTTQIFTTFLYKSSGGLWPRELVGKVVDWPVDHVGRGIGELGNPGVASAVESTPYSIGYLEWSYAIDRGLPIAAVQNSAGAYVVPTVESIEEAYLALEPPSPVADWSSYAYSVIYSPNPRSYPIVGQTFMIVPRYVADHPKCMTLKEFIHYIATEGQKAVPEGYAPLPGPLRLRALQAASMIKCGGG